MSDAAPKKQGRLAKLDINDVLEAAIIHVFPKGNKFGIRVRRNYGIALPPLLAQPGHISEVFVNILQNAREALVRDSEINVKTSYEGDYSFKVTIEDETGALISRAAVRVLAPDAAYRAWWEAHHTGSRD